MSHRSIAALARKLRGHAGLGRSRLETLCMLVVGMVGAHRPEVAGAGAVDTVKRQAGVCRVHLEVEGGLPDGGLLLARQACHRVGEGVGDAQGNGRRTLGTSARGHNITCMIY